MRDSTDSSYGNGNEAKKQGRPADVLLGARALRSTNGIEPTAVKCRAKRLVDWLVEPTLCDRLSKLSEGPPFIIRFMEEERRKALVIAHLVDKGEWRTEGSELLRGALCVDIHTMNAGGESP